MIRINSQGKISSQTQDTKGERTAFQRQPAVMSQADRYSDHISTLNHYIGNQAVQRLFKAGLFQAKLTIGQPNDIYEQEADRIADQVMRMEEPESEECGDAGGDIRMKSLADRITPLVQRQTEPEEEEEEEIQTKLADGIQIQRQEEEPEEEEEEFIQSKRNSLSESVADPGIESQINSLRGGGQPLPESARNYFEPRFGSGFDQVRVHNNSQAAIIAKSISARAFTTGKDIVFGAGEYSPETSSGRRLIAHELTHVVQQDAGLVKNRK